MATEENIVRIRQKEKWDVYVGKTERILLTVADIRIAYYAAGSYTCKLKTICRVRLVV